MLVPHAQAARFDKRSAGTPGKKPPAESVKVRRPSAFDTLVEILNRKSRQADEVKTGRRSKPVSGRRD
jgi:hypothetical protein